MMLPSETNTVVDTTNYVQKKETRLSLTKGKNKAYIIVSFFLTLSFPLYIYQ